MATESTARLERPPLPAALKKLLLRIYFLDEEAREGVTVLLEHVVAMLENERGCTLTYADVTGEGVLSVLALGNKELVRPIMQAAEDFNASMKHEGPLQ